MQDWTGIFFSQITSQLQQLPEDLIIMLTPRVYKTVGPPPVLRISWRITTLTMESVEVVEVIFYTTGEFPPPPVRLLVIS